MMGERFDVVIVGGAVMGSAAAHFILADPAFRGRVLVLEKDRTYASAASSRSTSGFRQQFSTRVNIELARYSAAFIKEADAHLSVESDRAGVPVNESGYLYLGGPEHLDDFATNHELQCSLGVDVALLSPGGLASRFPWLNLEDVAVGSLGLGGEGWFDGYLLMNAFRRKALAAGAQYRFTAAEGLSLRASGDYEVRLAGGGSVVADRLVLTAGTATPHLASGLGVPIPVRPLKQSVYSFRSPFRPSVMPYIFTPDGLFCRPDGPDFIGGLCIQPDDEAWGDKTESPDMEPDDSLFEQRLWPNLAYRIPAFEQVRFKGSWAGHYDFSLYDQNPFIGVVPGLPNLYLASGFSGHGIMQAPGVGRGLAELIVHGGYRTIDLADLAFERIARGRPVRETIQY
jgi:FAD-dependent oxidoreductase domain-containing protein 1